MHDYRLPCVSLGLIIYLQTSFSRTCDLEFKDVPSKTYQADFVFEAMVHRIASSGGGGGAGKGSKGKSIVRFRVSDVFKGTIDKETNADRYRTISVGTFGVKADPGRCIAPLPPLGSRYVLFLRSAETDSGIRAVKSEGEVQSPEFVLSSFPEPLSEDVIASVRRSTDKKFARKPKVRMPTKNLTFEPGQTARIQCIVSGRPTPKVNWFKDNVQMQSNKRVSFLDTKRGSTLVIRRLNSSDSGIYRCQAVNVVGSTSLNSTKGVFVSAAYSTTEAPVTPEKPFSVPCESDDYCLNFGTCWIVPALNKKLCVCQSDYTGNRCAEKKPPFDARLVSGIGTPSKKRRMLLQRYAM